MLKLKDSIEIPPFFEEGKQANIEDFEKSRGRIMKLLEEYEYGELPPAPEHLHAEILSEDRSFAAGKAVLRSILITLYAKDGESFSFPISSAIPTGKENPPAFIHINYTQNMPDKFQPTEELCDRGFAVFTLSYDSVASKDGKCKRGLSPFFFDKKRRLNSPGMLAVWAWTAMRVMDYAIKMGGVDKDNVAVIGHGALGSAALVAGAFDDRFKYVIANSSGFGGAALSHASRGRISGLKMKNPYLFSKRALKLLGKERTLPFDQHFLLALVAPRFLIIGIAEDDYTDAPYCEGEAIGAASEIYDMYFPNRAFSHIASFSRSGLPYLSRDDWAKYMSFIDENKNKS